MIIQENDKFILKIENDKYYFQGEEYENLILFLTNPNIKMPDKVVIDNDIKTEEDKYKATVYCDFVNSFISDRNEIDKEFISYIKDTSVSSLDF